MDEERHDDSEDSVDPEDLEKPPSFFEDYEPSSLEREFDPGEPVECRVDAVYATQTGQQIHKFVLLSDGSRTFKMVVGSCEATAITLALSDQKPDRPMTHDLMFHILEKLDGELERVVIDDLWGGTYYAKVYVRTKSGSIAIDARPTDAIALAIRAESRIFVAEGLLEDHGNM